jgi:hypothetical protein
VLGGLEEKGLLRKICRNGRTSIYYPVESEVDPGTRDPRSEGTQDLQILPPGNYRSQHPGSTDPIEVEQIIRFREVDTSQPSVAVPVKADASKAQAPRKRPRISLEESKLAAEEAIDALDLQKFRDKYPHLNIDDEHFGFKNHHLAIPANYHGFKKRTDWDRTFHTWCNATWKRPKEALPQSPAPVSPKGGWFE